MDWSLSAAANRIYNQHYAIVGHKDISRRVADSPNVAAREVHMNFEQMATQRKRVLTQWSVRFDDKTSNS